MSNLPQIIITADSEAVLAKKKAWSEIGLAVHNANLSLEAKAKAAIDLINGTIPKSIDEVLGAETVLKEVKATINSIESKRKEITSKFDKVSSALMTHEKLVKDALPAYQNAIIAIKKDYEAQQAKKALEEAAERKAKEDAINYINKCYNDMKNMVSEQCQKTYEYALNKPVTVEKLKSYLIKVKETKTEKDFTIIQPDNISLSNFSHAFKQVDMAAPADMLAYFHRAIDEKFKFYEVALKNKDAAIKAAHEQAEKEAAERAEELANAAVANRLETIATSIDTTFDNGVKELKKKYEIDMEDNEASALLIITAFVTNFKEAKEGIRVKSMMALSIAQMGSALAWMKNKDNAFSFTGINFKTVEKL